MRLLLCDSHRLYAESLAAALEQRGHEVLLAVRPVEALDLLEVHEPDLCLVAVRGRIVDGHRIVGDLSRREPRRPVVVLATADGREGAAIVAAGAAAVLTRDQPVGVILDAVDRIASGDDVASVVPAGRVPAPRAAVWPVPVAVEPLTTRERQVLGSLVDAQDTDEIARSLGVSPSTVRSHLRNVFVKLGVSSRLEAVARAVDMEVGGGVSLRRRAPGRT